MRAFAAFSNKALLAVALVLSPVGATASAADDAIDHRLRLLAREDARVATIFYRLQRAAEPDCTDKGHASGLVLHDLAQYAPEVRGRAVAMFGLDTHATILAVVPGSPADRAGLVPGDALMTVAGAPAPQAMLRRQNADASRDAATLLEQALARGDASLTIRRNGVDRTVSIAAETSCAGRIQLLPATKPDARGGEGRVTVTTALVELFDSDDALAFFIGHELAHIALRHTSKTAAAAQESDADWFGLKMVDRAGFDPSKAADALLRLAEVRHQKARFDPGHPSLKAREETLRAMAWRLQTRFRRDK